ncbi:YciI family protein [Streptomyces sp. NPDC059900]|uniref:YciI family protein n=1 Tax=Streptomyces sp. NPDC059900 TaxID=3155816 RepID=UPI003428A204
MWTIELRFTTDNAEHTAARLAARPAHRVALAALHADGRLHAAGPFADDSGALLILDVPTRTALDAVLAADPYFHLPAVQLTNIREWSPVVGPESR